MNTREIAEEYRLSHWAGIMRERAESGLSIKTFCKTAGFHQNVYFYWQRKLREAACRELLLTAPDRINKEIVPTGWAVCVPAKPEVKESSVSIEIGKFRVIASPDADEEHLAKVCRVLMSLC